MIKKLHHVDIIIAEGKEDLARSFYCDFLGLKEIEKPKGLKENGGLWLELDNAQIHLSIEREKGVAPNHTKAHLSYEIDSIAHWSEKIVAAGYEFKKCSPIPGFQRINTRDPFGNRIEMMERTLSVAI